MLNKKGQIGIVLIVVLVIVLIVGGIFYFNSGNQSSNGRIVIAITDAAADMGSVSEVSMTVDKIEAHSTTEGWVEISNERRTYDLLELKAQGKLEVAADTEVAAGVYDQFRMEISNVVVTDVNGRHQAKLPSRELKVNANVEVDSNSTSTASFDFIADESLHVTGNGQYILAPVIQVETRDNAEVEIESDNSVEISGGEIRSNIRVGMDENGNVGVGLRIPANANINIDSDGLVNIGLGGNANSNANANSNSNVAVNSGNSSVGIGIGVSGQAEY